MIDIVPETPALHAVAIEDLFDRTFGPGHFAKTAERLREYSASVPEVNRVAVVDGDTVVGVCRVWPLKVGKRGDRALFYGPVAVSPAWRGGELGLKLTEAALEAGKAAGWPAAVLIGAPAYFGRIGFTVTPRGRLTFPGPQDQSRVMVRDLAGDASVLEGLVTGA
ncbi:MAG: GNAT family N-acetyltransferase [Henriciella sp.]|jgi:predicted N-acetyltransferase YhbS|uniref:GNAT family N-acetyltransferase n=1 Tax=Henriciella sp. TaxID=1968823 RepID=UPI000C0F38EE|nr:N-acetyltransferase [Henriciella sp.]MAN74494.1 GNAT family N-acetyltransferase [Henriciella sp.]MBK74225.1 GNAT family N-acetyltransferase [Henriciella sp.]PHR81412.1 MAG: GNAT family N-acetyltransferase [Henriciella sp.]|tara:strand:+ start:4013 stop:4507 length:495 start_codon:yes stop_codon:yes gene_type:complete